MRALIASVLIANALVLPAVAQEPAVDGRCAALVETLGILNLADDSLITEETDGCTIRQASTDLGAPARYDFESLRLTSPDMFDRIARDLPPTKIDIALTGIRILPPFEDPLYLYVTRLQAVPFDIHIGYEWDSQTGLLNLTQASLSAGPDDRLSLSATLSGLTEDAFADGRMGIEPDIQLREVVVNLESRGLFINFIAIPLLYMLPPGEDPEPTIRSYREEAQAMLRSLPDALVDSPSKAVLSEFIATLPSPQNHYRFHLTLPEGFDLFALPSGGFEAALERLSGVSISASTIN